MNQQTTQIQKIKEGYGILYSEDYNNQNFFIVKVFSKEDFEITKGFLKLNGVKINKTPIG